jgi:hypothetical protein
MKKTMSEQGADQPKVSCWQCRHFNTSWDKNFPYLCRALNFKSRMLPCIEVRQSDGRECMAFKPKP